MHSDMQSGVSYMYISGVGRWVACLRFSFGCRFVDIDLSLCYPHQNPESELLSKIVAQATPIPTHCITNYKKPVHIIVC